MVEDKKLFIKSLEKDSTLRKSSCLEEKEEDLRLKVMKEKIIEWFSKTYMDNNGNLFDSEGKILAKVRLKFLVKY
jgi:hypothetical protein